jgi:16S rRNA (uracil1498-N3)-methyltransferase
LFVAGIHAPGDVVALADDDARKLLVVLRRASGDALDVIDSSGARYAATLVVGAGPGASAKLERRLEAPPRAALEITLAQGIPKGQKMDFVVEKATELGVARIVPFASSRTVGGDAGRDGKVERWRRLAKSAAAQCGRADVPRVDAPLAYADLLPRFAAYDAVFVPWELADRTPLRERLPPLLTGVRTVLVTIGPEGGLAESEAEGARSHGAHLISLGPRIFRTETAALITCTALLYASGDI